MEKSYQYLLGSGSSESANRRTRKPSEHETNIGKHQSKSTINHFAENRIPEGNPRSQEGNPRLQTLGRHFLQRQGDRAKQNKVVKQ